MDSSLAGKLWDNIANALVGIEYAKNTGQDVLIMQVDTEKAFDTIQWDFIAQTMTALGFVSRMCRVVYFLYENNQSAGILDGELTRLWDLGGSVRQGCPLSAMLYAIATHPLLLYLDYLTTSR
ncbi:hypothetical protein L7F22_012499 [Adiantum nelumboides]|nr:hypothetical protein [Adiantum nelumboides]